MALTLESLISSTNDFITCKYCGEKLHKRTKDGYFCGYELCECKEAQAQRRAYEQEELRQKEEEKAKRFKSICKRTNIKDRYIHAKSKLADELTDEILKANCNIYISGNIGTGKSYTASAIALNLALKCPRKSVLFTEAYELLDNVTKSYSGSDNADWSFIERVLKADYLVVDDLGKENYTEHVLSKIYQVFNERYARMLPTIVTSNYTLSELGERLSSKTGNDTTARSILSRIAENCKFITLKGKDRRLQGAL